MRTGLSPTASVDRALSDLADHAVRAGKRHRNVFPDEEVASSVEPSFLDLVGYRTGLVDLLAQHRDIRPEE